MMTIESMQSTQLLSWKKFAFKDEKCTMICIVRVIFSLRFVKQDRSVGVEFAIPQAWQTFVPCVLVVLFCRGCRRGCRRRVGIGDGGFVGVMVVIL